MTGQAKEFSDRDLRILTHYAAGTQLSAIASIVGVDTEDVREVVGEVASFERKKAGDLVAAHSRRQRAQASPKPTPPPARPAPCLAPLEPIVDVAAAAPAPKMQAPATPAAAPEPLLLVCVEDGDPWPCVDSPVLGHKPVDASSADGRKAVERRQRVIERGTVTPAEPETDHLAALLAAAADSPNARTRTLGVKLQELVDQLTGALAAERLEAAQRAAQEQERSQLEAEIAAAEQALAAARDKLRRLTGQASPPAREVRAWAAANGIDVNPLGIVPQRIVDQYHAAMNNQDAA